MKRKDILRKIAKLLALAGDNCNENEAANAALQARKLMQKFDIEEREVEGHDSTNETMTESVGSKKDYHKWEIRLAGYMREYLPVETIIKKDYTGRKRPAFIGHKADVEITLQMYDYIRKTIGRLGRKLGNSRAIRSFCIGASQTIYERFLQAKQEEKAKARKDQNSDEGKWALICIDKKKEIKQYIDQQFPDITEAKRRRESAIDTAAYFSGVRAGKNISLHQQIGK